MRIYIAHEKDTLWTIAQKTSCALEALAALNPAITDSNADLAGRQVRLPSSASSVKRNISLPICPPLPLPPSPDAEWLPLASLEDMQRTEYDVLIVGTGAGGGAALWRLIQQLGASGKRIGVLERGSIAIPTHAQNIATMDTPTLLQYKKRFSHTVADYFTSQVYALGGRTLFWGATSPRMPVSELAKWPIPIEEMNNYYTLAEKVMNVTGNYTKSAFLTQILLARLQRSGFADAIDEPIAINLEPVSQNGVLNSNPFFSSILFFAHALNASYDLAVNARVVKVLTDRNRAVGVEATSPDKRTYVLKAKHIVLAASTFGTTQILLNSGIHGPAIGHYFTNHTRVLGKGSLNRQEFPEVLGPLRILIPGKEDRPYQIQIGGPGDFTWDQYRMQPLRQEWDCYFAAFGEVESRYENHVYLDPAERDQDGVPRLKLQFSYSERDLFVIEQMAEGIKYAASAMNIPLTLGNGPSICLAVPGVVSHEMGTCRIGEDTSTSGTNLDGQIHGIQGLYAADGSVIPTSGTANITLTIVALAIRMADTIVRQLK
ncbi:GMC oxidoreductase [Paenibacillus sp. FSL H7-0326]|uniref:GMC oxidoreductase n=1 Tax=Paenibacillus sp. FSL H7-0326 TaxID=1921144 RepID=UPI0021170E0C|nr:GMC oxidoreductase [Paenibacillus sp. FSL H7-0326]